METQVDRQEHQPSSISHLAQDFAGRTVDAMAADHALVSFPSSSARKGELILEVSHLRLPRLSNYDWVMLQDFAEAIGLDIISSTVLSQLHRQVRNRFLSDDKSFAKRLAEYVSRQIDLDLNPKTLQSIVFDPTIWNHLATGSGADEEWTSWLHDLIPVGSTIRGPELAKHLSKGLRTITDREFRIAIYTLDGVNSLIDGQESLKDGQAILLEEMHTLKSSHPINKPKHPDESSTPSEAVREHLDSLDIHIERLTDEQMYVLTRLHGVRRALIPGAAGSGKTIVAAEKATRLDNAGLKTLLLCHNPYLATHLEGLTAGTTVQVRDFGSWINEIGPSRDGPGQTNWSRHSEPSDEALERGLDVLLGTTLGWDAIVIDEGQDFRQDWWVLIDAAVSEDSGILFVFADDDQRLLRHRDYIRLDEVHALSRNCRNAGAVYQTMRALVPGLARPEADLDGGSVCIATAIGRPSSALPLLSAHFGYSQDVSLSLTILVSDGSVESTIEELGSLPLEPATNWQKYLASILKDLHRQQRRSEVSLLSTTGDPSSIVDDGSLQAQLSQFSKDATPNRNDLRIVRSAVSPIAHNLPDRFHGHDLDSGRFTEKAFKAGLRPEEQSKAVGRLTTFYHASAMAAFLLHDDWAQNIARPATCNLVARDCITSDGPSARVYSVSEFKGLEAENVLVAWEPERGMSTTELYVAVSRSRKTLGIAILSEQLGSLPSHLTSRASQILR